MLMYSVSGVLMPCFSALFVARIRIDREISGHGHIDPEEAILVSRLRLAKIVAFWQFDHDSNPP